MKFLFLLVISLMLNAMSANADTDIPRDQLLNYSEAASIALRALKPRRALHFFLHPRVYATSSDLRLYFGLKSEFRKCPKTSIYSSLSA